MQINRLSRANRIPSDRVVTKGGQVRYTLTPQLAEWIRLMRRRPPNAISLEAMPFIYGCRPRKGPRPRNVHVILNEMKVFAREILARVDEVQEQIACKDSEDVLLRTLGECIMALIERDYKIRKIPHNMEAQHDAHDPTT